MERKQQGEYGGRTVMSHKMALRVAGVPHASGGHKHARSQKGRHTNGCPLPFNQDVLKNPRSAYPGVYPLLKGAVLAISSA